MLKDTLQRHKAFWERRDTDRPLLGVNAGFFVNQRFPRVMEQMPEGEVQPDDIPVELFLKDCDDLYESHAGLGDYPFVSAPFVGIPWLEAIAGCPIMASKSSFWAEPCITDWKTWRWSEFILENPWTKKLQELMIALTEHSSGRYGVAPTLMRGPSDILSAMRGAAELSVDLMDDPDAVLPSIDQATNLWKAAARIQLDLIPESDEGYIAGDAALRTWAPEKVLWLQEDAMSLLSPRLYKDFFLPVDRKLSDEFPCIAYHLHGSALWAVDDLVELPGVDVIELNLEAAFCDVEGTFAGWKKIQQRKPVIMWRAHGDDFKEWLEKVLREFPANGLSIQVSAFDPNDAKLAVKIFDEVVNAVLS
ncbi:MAG: hypothetical protein ACYC64_15190 [Armatimonadota bacterium]